MAIKNFRGIKLANILLTEHCVLIGDNNVGKTTILEAIDLVLGPDRLNRRPPIEEHDFYEGKYIADTSAVAVAGGGEAEPSGEPEGGTIIVGRSCSLDSAKCASIMTSIKGGRVQGNSP